MNNTRPSFYLISSAVDGNVNAIEKILALYDPYISKCCLRPFYDKYGNVCIANSARTVRLFRNRRYIHSDLVVRVFCSKRYVFPLLL